MINQTYIKPYVPGKYSGGYYPTTQQQHPAFHQQQAKFSPQPRDYARAIVYGISTEEYMRRDRIVRELFLKAPFKIGQILKARNADDNRKYGKLELKGIYASYYDFLEEEAKQWPKDDNPYTCTVKPEHVVDGAALILCTTDYLMAGETSC